MELLYLTENFYLRSLPSQPPLISANHGLPPISRAGPGHPQGSCSRDMDPGGGVSLHKGLKEGSVERGVVPSTKDKERPSSKQEAKERQQHHSHHPQSSHPHHHHPHPGHTQPQAHQQHPQYPQHPVSLEEVNSRALERHMEQQQALGMTRTLSACLLNGKMQNGGDSGTGGAKASMTSYGGEVVGSRGAQSQASHRHMEGGGNVRCTKEGVSGEMRISEQPSDCLEGRGQMLHHGLPYSVAPPLQMGSAAGGGHPHLHPHHHPHPHPGGFHCLQLHPSHPHHPHTHHHPDFFCPPPPAPLTNPSPHERGGGRDPKVTGPTFIPSVGGGHLGDKSSGQPFQMGTPTDCQGLVGGGGSAKDKAMEKSGGGAPPSNWHRKQQQQHPYRKAEKAPDWMQQQSHHHHPQQPQPQQTQQPQQPLPQQPQPQQPQPQQHQPQQHQAVRSRSVECINSVGVDTTDVFRPSLPQGAKAGHSLPHSVNTSPYRDCSLPGPLPNASPLGGRGGAGGGAGGGSCSLQRDGQKVARIRHQQHGGPGPDVPAPELNQSKNQNQDLNRKLEMEMSPYGYSNSGQGQQHHPQQPPVPPWAMRPHHVHPAEEEQQRKAYMESLSGGRQQPQQQPGQGMGLPPHPSPQPQPQPPPPPAPSQQHQDPQVASQAQEESSAMKSLLKYSTQQPLLLSQKSPFGGLGSLKSGGPGGPGGGAPGVSCTLQGSKQQQALPTRKGPANDGERSDCGGRGREVGEAVGHGEGEVRQPPVGIAVAVARQREPSCRPVDAHPNSRQGRVHPSMKGTGVTSGLLGSLA